MRRHPSTSTKFSIVRTSSAEGRFKHPVSLWLPPLAALLFPVNVRAQVNTGNADSYSADFELPVWQGGSVDGQGGWKVDQGTADIVAGEGFEGTTGLVLSPYDPFSQAKLSLTAGPSSGGTVTFVELYARPVASSGAEKAEFLDIDSARVALLRESAEAEMAALWVFAGNHAGGGEWIKTAGSIPVDKDTGRVLSWLRLTLREDLSSQSWDLWVNGNLAGASLGFQERREAGGAVYIFMGDHEQPVALDNLGVFAVNPLGVDTDEDGMLDTEEQSIGSNPSLADRLGVDSVGTPFQEKWWRLLVGENQPFPEAPLPPPVFSKPSSVIHVEFSLTISTSGVSTVYYTTNGNIPRPETAQTYTGPIGITRTTVIRACAVDDRGRFSEIAAAAWIFPEDVPAQSKPLEWPEALAERDIGGTQSLYELDPRMLTGQSPLPSVEEVAAALEKAPIVVLSMEPEALFGAHGVFDAAPSPSLRKQAEVVWMDTRSGQFGGASQATLTLSGQSSRRHEVTLKHSIRVTLPGVSSAATLFGGETFPVNQFLLRHPTQDSWAVGGNFADRRDVARYITDAWSSHWMRNQGHVAPAHQWVHVFLNGSYWGVYEAVEQHDNAYSARHPEAGSQRHLVEPGEGGGVRAVLGSAEGWIHTLQKLRQLSAKGDSASDAEWEQGTADVDRSGLTDYIFWNWWTANEDWPSRNWIASLEAGKWRFLSWDAEMALPADPDIRTGTAARLATDGTGPAAAFTALCRWKGFREAVLARFNSLAEEGALADTALLRSLEAQTETFKDLAAAESARWGGKYASPPLTPADWQNRIQWVRLNYIPGRTEEMRLELTEWLAARAAESRRFSEPEPEPAAVVPEIPDDQVDSDGDGMPDVWELRFGLNPFNPEDAVEDPDRDGLNNSHECARGTNPTSRDRIPALNENSPGVHTKFQEYSSREEPVPPEAGTLDTPKNRATDQNH